ncbi:hypothetical protein DMENIID0001_116870 [Sergentomyia squamirostris]
MGWMEKKRRNLVDEAVREEKYATMITMQSKKLSYLTSWKFLRALWRSENSLSDKDHGNKRVGESAVYMGKGALEIRV